MNSKDINKFRFYLNNIEDLTIKLKLYDNQTQDVLDVEFPYITRWHEQYRRRTLAKFYKFNDWWEKQGRPDITMLTLTTYQGDTWTTRKAGLKPISIEDSFRILNDSWRKLRLLLTNKIIGHKFEYIATLEPHESGFPHMHLAILYKFSDNQQEEIKKIWSEKYKAGSYKYGADFSNSDLSAKTGINYAGFYIFKYLGKSFACSLDNMTLGELKFNVCLWKYGYRQITMSRGLSKVTKLDSSGKSYDLIKSSISNLDCEFTIRDRRVY